MKIAITDQDSNLQSPLDPRFGRAKWFAIIDIETGTHQFADNQQNLSARQGAGIQAASQVARLGAKAVVTGNVGPKAFSALRAAGLDVYVGATGTVQEAFDLFKAGKLESANKATVEGHWV